ncbi:MAG: hypothetical protein ACRD1B_05905, partial [Thermoanaerobaculia bacterium]
MRTTVENIGVSYRLSPMRQGMLFHYLYAQEAGVDIQQTNERGLERFGDPLLGGGELAAGGVEIHEIAGGHVTILLEPHVRALADGLRTCLGKSQGEEPGGPDHEA